MRSQKLVIVHWDLGIGGAKSQIIEFAQYVARRKEHTVTILLKRSNAKEIDIFSRMGIVVKSYSDTVYKGHAVFFFFWILLHLWKTKPDSILTFNNRFVLVGVTHKLLSLLFFVRVRLIHNQVVYLSKYIANHEHKIWHAVVFIIYRWCDLIISLHNEIDTNLQRQYFIPKDRRVIVPNWVLPPVERKILKSKKYDVMFIGRFNQDKRPLLFLDIIKQLVQTYKHTTIRACMVGEGDLLHELQKKIHADHLQQYVKIVGYTKNAYSIMSQSKILVLPTQNEGVPRVVLEAGLLGIPSVLTPYKGAEYAVINGVTGLIADEHTIAKQVGYLLHNPSIANRLGENAQRYIIKHFGASNMRLLYNLVFYSGRNS